MEPETKQQILDAAETLFARKGYKATSLRDLTMNAGVNLASVNYHFGSKKRLLEAIFERRLQPLNESRLQKLKEIRKAAGQQGENPAVREILKVFIEPVLRARESHKGEIFLLNLVGRAFIDLDVTVQEILRRFMKPLSDCVIETLSKALPEIPREVIFWRLQFVLGALGRTMFVYRNPALGKPKEVPDVDPETLLEYLVSFATKGIEEPGYAKSFKNAPSPGGRKGRRKVK